MKTLEIRENRRKFNLVNTVCDCKIIPGFKSDHSVVTISMLFTIEPGYGYFKINYSPLLQSEYQENKIKLCSGPASRVNIFNV